MNFIFSLIFGVLKVVPRAAAQLACKNRLPLITPEISFVTFDCLLLLRTLCDCASSFSEVQFRIAALENIQTVT
jgi:hypothetical protein